MSDVGKPSTDGGERWRRTWSAVQKQRIIAESFAPTASVAEVASRYGLNANMLFPWRRREQQASGASAVRRTSEHRAGEGHGGDADCDRRSSGLDGSDRDRACGWLEDHCRGDVDATALADLLLEAMGERRRHWTRWCQSARKGTPGSACKRNPLVGDGSRRQRSPLRS